MKKIFIGLILIFVSLKFNGIDLIPQWLGYILICFGLESRPGCPSLSGTLAIGVGAIVLSFVPWLIGLFGTGMAFPLGAILQLLITYRLVLWCEEQELDDGYLIHRFRLSWYALAGATGAAVALGTVAPALGVLWALVALVAAIYYIYIYYRMWKQTPILAEAEKEDGEEDT